MEGSNYAGVVEVDFSRVCRLPFKTYSPLFYLFKIDIIFSFRLGFRVLLRISILLKAFLALLHPALKIPHLALHLPCSPVHGYHKIKNEPYQYIEPYCPE